MPTREQIVEWLREAAMTERIIAAACATGDLPRRFMQESIDKATLFDHRAAQVLAMRCETCKHYDDTYHICEVIGPSERYIPESFGCFHHEPKE